MSKSCTDKTKIDILSTEQAGDAASAYSPLQLAFLFSIARLYIWWKPAAEAIKYPERLIAQIMDIGTLNHIAELREHFTDDELASILKNAIIGWFSPRSWHYWHYVLLGTPIGCVPPLPTNRF